MAFGFLNALMLFGLAAVALPVLAHLISKRRFEVVQWGAMRFLELGHRTKRRFRLQDILLLLLRIGLVACLALAIARPWGQGGLFAYFSDSPPQDYVFVLDGSASMGWENQKEAPGGKANKHFRTPQAEMLQWVHDAIEKLRPGDTIAVIDAREQPRRLLSSTSDLRMVRQTLSQIPPPAGTSRIPLAIEDALKVLSTATNAMRRIVVLSDDQKLAWTPNEELSWMRVDELREMSPIPPEIDIVILGESKQPRQNFSVGRIELSRAVTVPEFPVKIRAMIRQSGGNGVERKKVSLLIDGQEVPGKTVEIDLPAGSEGSISFDHAFPTVGEFLVTVSIEPDPLPVDNSSNAVLSITSGIPVLLVDGDRNADLTRSETFYLQSVLAASGAKSRWIQDTTILPHELNEAALEGQKVVFLCNVERLSAQQWGALRKYVQEGGGLVIAPGEKTSPALFNQVDAQEKESFLPAMLKQIVEEQAEGKTGGMVIDSLSLEVPWLHRFRQENGVDFAQTRFMKWWRLEQVHPADSGDAEEQKPHPETASVSEAFPGTNILARFSNGDPFLIQRNYGEGVILQLAVPLDADWSTLPAKNDFLPLIYELVFVMTGKGQQRNVTVGSPLLLPLKGGETSADFVVTGPGISNQPVELVQRSRSPYIQFRQTSIPGVYRFHRKNDAADRGQVFVVDDDHAESDLAPLSERDWDGLMKEQRFQRMRGVDELTAASARQAPRTEFWWGLMILVLLLLICEVALTRRMVQGGNAAVNEILAEA